MLMRTKVLVAALLLAAAPSAIAGVVAVGLLDFPPGLPVITFDGLGGPADGVTVDGVTFHYPAGGLAFDVGPPLSNHVTAPSVVSFGAADGVLTMDLPAPVTMFGFGWAVLSADPIVDALRISVFNGAALLGSLDYGGAPDPLFAGGFAGIQSSGAFNRVEVTFAPSQAQAFALDDIIQAVPEPSTFFVGAWALAALGLLRRRRSTHCGGVIIRSIR